MPKILSRGGFSLADIYNIRGSKVIIDDLVSEGGVHLFHEMGHTIFAERFQQQIHRTASAAITQSTEFNAVSSNMPQTPTRILGITVITTNVARLSSLVVSLTQSGNREFPIFVWDQTNSVTVRVVEDGNALATFDSLSNAPGMATMPTMFPGTDQQASIDGMILRGITPAFGAGDVTTIVLLNIALSERASLGSRGLPIPSW